MWFEADFVPSYPIIEGFSVDQPGLDVGITTSDALTTFPGSPALVTRPNLFGVPDFGADWAGLRDLYSPLSSQPDEWGEVSPSKGGDMVMSEDETIVVTGRRTIRLDLVSWWDVGPGSDLFWTVHLDGGGGGAFEPGEPADEEAIDVLVNFDRPLTESEAQALENFKTAIELLTAAINSLADSAEVRLPNGSYINGAALKALWADTDFIINDNVRYENNTRGGEAWMIDGEPTISFNIQYLDAYDNSYGGMNYLIAHDFAHLTQWGMPNFYDQLTANDIAREILSSAGLPYLPNPDFGYTGIAPFGFSTPSGIGGDDSGGGAGEGGGGGGDYIP